VRESIVEHVDLFRKLTILKLDELLDIISINKNRYYSWKKRMGLENRHNGKIPKNHFATPEEIKAVINYAMSFDLQPGEYIRQGYRRLTYEMIDEDIAYLHPSTVYRILKKCGILNQWRKRNKSKGKGFKQPTKPHQHWHIDIKYVNFQGTFLFLISIIDGFSRYIVHHELFWEMTELMVEITVQSALDKYPGVKPRIISDNGGQFISREFKKFIKVVELLHVRTSTNYPQSNGKIERFHRTITNECLRTNSFITEEDTKRIIAKYIEYYNNERLHSSLNYLPPVSYLNGTYEVRLSERKEKLKRGVEKRREYWLNKKAS
jgi:transposase InsO family protein